MQIDMNASVRNDHVPEIDRLNRAMNEHIRLVYTELIQVYGRVLGVLVRKIVYAVTFWPNIFPSEDGVSDTLIP